MTTSVKRFAALKASLRLSVLFLIVYGFTNWLAAHRSHVGTLFFEWERYTPFIPLMIIPYLSIDVFFVAAPFACRDARELSVLARRVTFAILVAGLCFLLFPLRFAFDRPLVSGWLGAMFSAFRSFDRPFNLVPSLHITFQLILAHLYARHTTGMVRLASNIWFTLIGVSTLLTWQHHVMDVVGGVVLAGYCFYSFPESPFPLGGSKNRRLGGYYAVASALALISAVSFWPWGIILLWPALSLAIVSAGYLAVGPAIFRKTDGRLPLSTRFVLGPCIFGQWLSLLYYRRQCRKWDEVAPGVLIGRKLNDREAAGAIDGGVTAVLDLTAEFSEAKPFLRLEYLNVPILDLTAPTQSQLKQIVEFIEEQTRSGKVYVHCKIGYSRSAAAGGAWLLASGHAAKAAEVLAILRRVRPSIIVRPEVVRSLSLFAETHNSSTASLVEQIPSERSSAIHEIRRTDTVIL